MKWKSAAIDGGNTGGGPFAIWAYGSGIVMQYNEVFRQRISPACPWDGGAFNINGSGSIMHYNYSHDNEGLPFLLDHTHDSIV